MSDSTSRPIRVIVFPERPEALLVVAPDGQTEPIALPALVPPFAKASVADSLRTAGVFARLIEETPGRWQYAMRRAKREEHAESAQRNKLREATTAALARGSADPLVRDHGALLARKHEVDEEIAKLKQQIGTAKSRAFTRGEYMPPADFRRLEARLDAAKLESQALQGRLRDLKQERKRQNIERSEARDKSFERRFFEAAKELLDPEDFADILDATRDDDEEQDGAA